MKTKKFKAFDKVIVKIRIDTSLIWTCTFYSHLDKDGGHVTIGGQIFDDKDILLYEGNEELVGTTDEPETEVRLEEGEWMMCAAGPYDYANDWALRQFVQIRKKAFLTANGGLSSFAIRFKDFDPSNMEETKKNILCVKNGKIIRYKG